MQKKVVDDIDEITAIQQQKFPVRLIEELIPGCNLFFLRHAANQNLLGLLQQIKDYQDEEIVGKLDDYVQQLDQYQRAYELYKQDKNKQENVNQLGKAVHKLRLTSNELHQLLLAKPASIAAIITTFLGITFALVLLPITFFAGAATTVGTLLSLVTCYSIDTNPSRSDLKSLLIMVFGIAALPYYSLLLGARLGRQVGESMFFKAPKSIDTLRQQTINQVNFETYNERIKNTETSWYNKGDFNFYQFDWFNFNG